MSDGQVVHRDYHLDLYKWIEFIEDIRHYSELARNQPRPRLSFRDAKTKPGPNKKPPPPLPAQHRARPQ